MTFAFGLATLGTVMAVSLRAYVRAAVEQERTIIDGISLESASYRLLGSLAEGVEQPIAPGTTPPLEINGRAVTLEISLPEGKRDLAMDSSELLTKDLKKADLPTALVELARDKNRGLADLSRLAGLTATSEDCLRRTFTLGRAPEEVELLAAVGSESKLTRRVMPGDQVDLRAAISREERTKVLWQRARFTGVGSMWLLHDDRRIHLKSPTGC